MKPSFLAVFFLLLMCVLLMGGNVFSESKQAFPHARLSHSCAPWDGAAIALQLTPKYQDCKTHSYPDITISFWRNLPKPFEKGNVFAQKKFELETNSQDGAVVYCSGPSKCQRATSATVTFENFSSDSSETRGRYDLVFPDQTINGWFKTAPWCQERVLCGG